MLRIAMRFAVPDAIFSNPFYSAFFLPYSMRVRATLLSGPLAGALPLADLAQTTETASLPQTLRGPRRLPVLGQ